MHRYNGFLTWLPVLLGAAVILATLVLWNALKAREEAQIARIVQTKAQAFGGAIGHEMESRIQALERMASRAESHRMPPRNEWESDAALYLKHYPGYQAIEWVDSSFRVRWIVPHKDNGYGTVVGPDEVSQEQRKETLSAARDKHRTTLSLALNLRNGGEGFLACAPIFSAQGFGGFITGVFRNRDLFEAMLHDEVVLEGYDVALFSGGETLYAPTGIPGARELQWAKSMEIQLYGVTWRVQVWPRADTLAQIQSPLPEVTLVSGIVLALMFGLAVYFAQAARLKEQEVEAMNHELRAENLERYRAEEAAARHAREVERSNAELQQFAYVASHDLQEPLRIVSGYVQLLARRYKGRLDADADEFIAFAVDGATRMQSLISDLLAYSRVGSRGETFRPVDCEEVLGRALASLQVAIEESGAAVTHDPLPTIMGDARQLDQLFLNLIGNAIKYRSETRPMIHVSAQEKGHEWLFSVRDNGIGIDPKYFERIFVIFQRLHGRGEYPGTGIGLAICKKVVENHGGRIWVESQPAAGATFYFMIPKTGRSDASQIKRKSD